MEILADSVLNNLAHDQLLCIMAAIIYAADNSYGLRESVKEAILIAEEVASQV